MAEQEEVRVTHEEVEGFVAKLKDFHRSLSESEQVMLETVLEGAQEGDTGGYIWALSGAGGASGATGCSIKRLVLF